MLSVKFTFTTNRYHATQWGRHVNEGVLEWPPSPWRILRGIVATWRRALPDLPPEHVVPILEALAAERPGYRLPMAASGHTRHYMPYNEGRKERTTLVIDSFVAIKPREPLFVIWPETDLSLKQLEILDAILRKMPYLGRAESWVEAEVMSECQACLNSFALDSGSMPEGDWEIVRTLVPKPKIKLKDLLIETSDLRRVGRVDPEGAEWWVYVRKQDCFNEFRAKRETVPFDSKAVDIQVIRFALAGPVLPNVCDTLRWGDLARKSVMAQFGRQNEGKSSPTLSGKDISGSPLQGHPHAFYLPTDEDSDGRLDHLTIWAPTGLGDREFHAATSIRTLNLGNGGGKVQVAYQAHGEVKDFVEVVPSLFGSSKHWRSLTPYVLTRHVKFRGPRDESGRKRIVDGPEDQIRREVRKRWSESPDLVKAERFPEGAHQLQPIKAGVSRGYRPIEFFRFRRRGSNGGGAFNFEIEFDEPVSGPIALGFACHFGLGLFVPIQT